MAEVIGTRTVTVVLVVTSTLETFSNLSISACPVLFLDPTSTWPLVVYAGENKVPFHVTQISNLKANTLSEREQPMFTNFL